MPLHSLESHPSLFEGHERLRYKRSRVEVLDPQGATPTQSADEGGAKEMNTISSCPHKILAESCSSMEVDRLHLIINQELLIPMISSHGCSCLQN